MIKIKKTTKEIDKNKKTIKNMKKKTEIMGINVKVKITTGK